MQKITVSNPRLANPAKTSGAVLKDLPKHPAPRHNHLASKLIVLGAVRKPTSVSLQRLHSLPRVKLSEDFRCLEGWVVKNVLWEGVPVKSILQDTGLKKSARFLLFRSGSFTYSMDLKKAMRITTLLALKKSGRWLTTARGGPIRLVFKGHDCYESVKWVSRIEVLTRRPSDTARRIALSRISAS